MSYRMYHLVMYNISPIQQGIQAYHAGMEYARKYWKNKDFQSWLKNDKVVIILNGGTSHNIFESPLTGTMEQHKMILELINVKCASFTEPDLNNSTSAIAFLVPDKVWDKEKYPDFPSGVDGDYDDIQKERMKWIKLIGKKNISLREFLSKFRLA